MRCVIRKVARKAPIRCIGIDSSSEHGRGLKGGRRVLARAGVEMRAAGGSYVLRQ